LCNRQRGEREYGKRKEMNRKERRQKEEEKGGKAVEVKKRRMRKVER
jgi:hypothetical protein